MYRVDGSRETRYNCLKIANIYTLMKIKPTFIIKQPQIYTTSTSLSTQKNKRNFSTRGSSQRFTEKTSLPLSDSRPTRRKDRRLYDIPVAPTRQLLSSQQLDHRCCRRNS